MSAERHFLSGWLGHLLANARFWPMHGEVKLLGTLAADHHGYGSGLRDHRRRP
jgi:hypothetical protein